MFAIVEIYGKQYKVAKGDRVLVNSKIDVAEGKTIKFGNKAVLFIQKKGAMWSFIIGIVLVAIALIIYFIFN